MKTNMTEILTMMIKTYQDELDDVLEDYSLICAVLGLLKEHGAHKNGNTIRHLQRRKNKIADKMKDIQVSLNTAQEELNALEKEKRGEEDED